MTTLVATMLLGLFPIMVGTVIFELTRSVPFAILIGLIAVPVGLAGFYMGDWAEARGKLRRERKGGQR